PRYLFHPCRQFPGWLERAPTQAPSSCVSRPCPPVSGPSASDLRGRDGPTVSWVRVVRVFHIGNFPSTRSFLICLDRSCPEPSTNVPSPDHSRSAVSGDASCSPRASGTITFSDSCMSIVSHFAFAYRVRLPGLPPGRMQVSWGHT